MIDCLLIDTDVIIDYLRDNPDVVKYLENAQVCLLVSVITVAELYAGVREGEERVKLEQFLKAFEVISIEKEIAMKGGLYRRDYQKSHGIGLADALIAATADTKQATLVTLNRKHFSMLTNVVVPYRKP